MSEFDDVQAQIDSLHEQAEELAEQAKRSEHPEGLRRKATALVRQAARLRAQIGED